MINYKYNDLFAKDHIDKQLKIKTDDGLFTATNSDIHFEDFELTESLCSESELKFGSCEASMVKFQIRNAFISLSGKWMTVTETLEGNTDVPFQYGRYKVFSDKPTADREYRDIIAYDAMYDIINADVTAWYNTILPNKDSTKTLKQFRESFIQYFGLTEVVPDGGLVNDNMTVERTIEPEQISGKDVITAICEISGCFGHIGRDEKFHYIYLPQDIQGIYPADFLYPDHVPEQWDYLSQAETGHLYPQDTKSMKLAGGTYISCQYEDYIVRQINKLQIRQEENNVGIIYGEGDNCYVIQDNFLVYGKSAEELNIIAKNIYNKITGIIYRPFSCEAVGNPCLETGDSIRFNTKYEIIESYVFTRTLKGIQSLRDNYTASGEEKRTEEVNSMQKSIVQLKGKTNTLERNVDETISELKNLEENTESRFTQTAELIEAEVTRATEEEVELAGRITIEADRITEEVTQRTDGQNELSSRIEQTVKNISLTVNNGEKTAGIVITLESEDGTTDEISGTIEMTGIVTFNNLETEGQTIINGDNITTGTINCDLLNGGTINGQTISGGTINGSTITSDNIYLGNELNMFLQNPLTGIRVPITVMKTEVSSNAGGLPHYKIVIGEDAENTLFSNVEIGALCTFSKGVQANSGLNVVGDISVIEGGVTVYGNYGLYNNSIGNYLVRRYSGTINDATVEHNRFGNTDIPTAIVGKDNVYSNHTISVYSDERIKRYFETLEKYEKWYMDIKPVAYKFVNGSSGRTHIGTSAQSIRQSLEENGFTTKDFAGYVEMPIDPDMQEYIEDGIMCGLRYEEFIMLNTHMIQKLYKITEKQNEKIEQQQMEIDGLKASISFLMGKIEEMEEKINE